MPTFDANMMFRTTAALTQSESLGPITVYGGQQCGLAARVIVPGNGGAGDYGANDTVLPRVYASSDGSTYNLVSTYAKGAQKPGTGNLELIVPFPVFVGKRYIKLELVVTVASTSPNFGTVFAGIVQNPGFDWDRSSDSLMH